MSGALRSAEFRSDVDALSTALKDKLIKEGFLGARQRPEVKAAFDAHAVLRRGVEQIVLHDRGIEGQRGEQTAQDVRDELQALLDRIDVAKAGAL
jgi:hypothetical protein